MKAKNTLYKVFRCENANNGISLKITVQISSINENVFESNKVLDNKRRIT